MKAFSFETKFKFAFLAPVAWSSEFQERTLRIASINFKFFFIVYLKAIDPHIDLNALIDRSEILNFLENDKPWVHQELSCFIHDPDSYSSIGATRYQLFYT